MSISMHAEQPVTSSCHHSSSCSYDAYKTHHLFVWPAIENDTLILIVQWDFLLLTFSVQQEVWIPQIDSTKDRLPVMDQIIGEIHVLEAETVRKEPSIMDVFMFAVLVWISVGMVHYFYLISSYSVLACCTTATISCYLKKCTLHTNKTDNDSILCTHRIYLPSHGIQ